MWKKKRVPQDCSTTCGDSEENVFDESQAKRGRVQTLREKREPANDKMSKLNRQIALAKLRISKLKRENKELRMVNHDTAEREKLSPMKVRNVDGCERAD